MNELELKKLKKEMTSNVKIEFISHELKRIMNPSIKKELVFDALEVVQESSNKYIGKYGSKFKRDKFESAKKTIELKNDDNGYKYYEFEWEGYDRNDEYYYHYISISTHPIDCAFKELNIGVA